MGKYAIASNPYLELCSQKTPQTRAKRSALSQQVTTKHISTRRAQRHSKHKTEQKHTRSTKEVPRALTFWFWRRRFLKGFYHIWAWRPSWSCDQDHLNKLSFPHPKESPYEISVQLAQWFQRRRCLKMLTDDG